MTDTLLHCFACEAFAPQNGDLLQCSVCESDFVEVVQVERSPTGRAQASTSDQSSSTNNAPASDTPGFPGMLTNLLSSILPTGIMNAAEQDNARADQRRQSMPDDSTNDGVNTNQSAQNHATPDIPPFNDFFSQMFGQFPQGRGNGVPSNGTNYTRTTHGPGNSSFTFSFGSSFNGQPVFFSSAGGPGNDTERAQTPSNPAFAFGNVNDGIPQIQNFPDLASFLSQALGAVPGRAGDYASGETFDNIISELMNRNPQSNVQAATERAISQIHRFQVKEGAEGLAGSKVGEECSICQEDYKTGDTLVDLRCHHVYHEECLLSWVKTNGVCPICRAAVVEFEETPEQEALD